MPNAAAARVAGSLFALTVLVVSTFGPSPVSAGERGFMGLGRSDDERQRERAIEQIRKRAVVVEEGTSDSAVRRSAAKELPLAKLSNENRGRVDEVLEGLSLFRKLPTITVPADPQLYDYFVENPDVAVSIWRAMNISTFEMKAAGAGRYDAKVEDGTEGTVELLHRTPTEAVVLCEGTFKAGPLVRPVSAKCVLHLRSEYGHQRDGTAAVRHRVTMFVAFPSQTVETAAKLVSPVSNIIIDRNFRELSLFLHMMTLLSEQRPAAVDSLAERLEGVTKDQQTSLRRVSANVHQRALVRERRMSAAGPRDGVERTARANDD